MIAEVAYSKIKLSEVSTSRLTTSSAEATAAPLMSWSLHWVPLRIRCKSYKLVRLYLGRYLKMQPLLQSRLHLSPMAM